MSIYTIMTYLAIYPYMAIAETIALYIIIGMTYIILNAWSQHRLKIWMILFLVCDIAMAFLLLLPWSNLSLFLYGIAVLAWIIALVQMIALG